MSQPLNDVVVILVRGGEWTGIPSAYAPWAQAISRMGGTVLSRDVPGAFELATHFVIHAQAYSFLDSAVSNIVVRECLTPKASVAECEAAAAGAKARKAVIVRSGWIIDCEKSQSRVSIEKYAVPWQCLTASITISESAPVPSARKRPRSDGAAAASASGADDGTATHSASPVAAPTIAAAAISVPELAAFVDNPVAYIASTRPRALSRLPLSQQQRDAALDITSGPNFTKWLATRSEDAAPSSSAASAADAEWARQSFTLPAASALCPTLQQLSRPSPSGLGRALIAAFAPDPICSALSPSSRALFIDVDDCIIRASHGGGWRFTYSSVPSRVAAFAAAGYRIVLVTNQSGPLANTDKVAPAVAAETRRRVKQKLQSAAQALKVPVLVLAAADFGFFRKPQLGLLWLFETFCAGGVELDAGASLFVGDMAGRRIGAFGAADHSASDLGWALNAGIPFTTPEAFFGGSRRGVDARPLAAVRQVADWAPHDFAEACAALARAHVPRPSPGDPSMSAFFFLPRADWPPRASKLDGPSEALSTAAGDAQELVLLAGPPGSGKSSIAKQFSAYTCVNQDRIGSRARVVSAVRAALSEGKSVVVDRTHHSRDARKTLLTEVFEGGAFAGVRVRALAAMGASMKILAHSARHSVMHREHDPLRERKQAVVPAGVSAKYAAEYTLPDASEGFAAVDFFSFTPGACGEWCPAGCGLCDLAEALFLSFRRIDEGKW
jgi:bifunctional polynucleotide phosphatase/kinase